MKRQYDIGVRQQQNRKDSGSSTVTHVDIKGGSRSGSESSHPILQDLQCNFRFDLFFTVSLVFVFVIFRFIFSSC